MALVIAAIADCQSVKKRRKKGGAPGRQPFFQRTGRVTACDTALILSAPLAELVRVE